MLKRLKCLNATRCVGMMGPKLHKQSRYSFPWSNQCREGVQKNPKHRSPNLRYFWTPQSENMMVYFLQGFIWLYQRFHQKLNGTLPTNQLQSSLLDILWFGPFRGLVHSLEISEGKNYQPQTQCTSKNHKKNKVHINSSQNLPIVTFAVCVCVFFAKPFWVK